MRFAAVLSALHRAKWLRAVAIGSVLMGLAPTLVSPVAAQVWSATLNPSGESFGLSGYCKSNNAPYYQVCEIGSVFNVFGSLDNGSFTMGADAYEVWSIRHYGGFQGDNTLHLTLNNALTADQKASLSLTIGTSTFALADAGINPQSNGLPTTNGTNYLWSSVSVRPWTNGTDIAVSLSGGSAGTLVLSETEVEVEEGDVAGVQYTVKLSDAPTGDVTVDIELGQVTDLTVTPSMLMFSTLNWSSAQTVVVTAQEDDDGLDDEEETVTHTAAGGGYITTAEVQVTITDDDGVSLVLSATEVEVDEGDVAGVQYTVSLSDAPTGDVTVDIELGQDTDLTVTPSMLTFTTMNWSSAQTVMVTAQEDDDGLDDEEETVTHTADGGMFTGVTAEVDVTIGDNDAAFLYVERNGSGDCSYNSPCSFPEAIGRVENDYAVIFVRLRSEGSITAIFFDEEVEVLHRIRISTYVENGDEPMAVKGTVVLKGDLNLGGAVVTAHRGTALRLESDEIILSGPVGAAGFRGAVELGNGDKPQLVTGGAGCLQGTFEQLTINGNVEMNTGANCSGTEEPRLTVRHSLRVRQGMVLDMADVELVVASELEAADPGALTVEEDAKIVGSENLVLSPEEEMVSGSDLDGFANTPAGCFRVTGKGSIEMEILKMGQGGVCIDMAEIGDGGTFINRGGTVFMTAATRFDGTFRNMGRARTEFWKLEDLTEDLEILGTDRIDAANIAGSVGGTGVGASVNCDQDGMTSRYSGVYFFTPVRIYGGVYLRDTDNSSTANCVEGLYFLGDSAPEIQDNSATPAGTRPERTSTVFGPYEAKGNSRTVLDAHNFYHNLALEDDFYAESGNPFPLVSMASITPEFIIYRDKQIPSNICGFDRSFQILDEPRTAYGNKIIFSGEFDQDIRLPEGITLDIGSVQINKTALDAKIILHEEQAGAALRIQNLEIRSGVLVTNGKLDMSDIDLENSRYRRLSMHDDGSLDKGSAMIVYVSQNARPAYIRYTGTRSQVTGDEILSPYEENDGTQTVMQLPWLEVFKSRAATVTLSEELTIGVGLNLYSGTLAVAEDKTLYLQRNVSVGYGSGDLNLSDGGDVTLLVGENYMPRLHGLSLEYGSGVSRSAGQLWPSAESAFGGGLVRDIVISSRCELETRAVVALNPGYSHFANSLRIVEGALDIAGHNLVAFGDASENAPVTIDVGVGGFLCDSVAGVPCMAGSQAARKADESAPNPQLRHARRQLTSATRLQRSSGVGMIEIELKDENALMRIVGRSETGYPAEQGAVSSIKPAIQRDLTDSIMRGLGRVREVASPASLENLREQILRLKSARASHSKSAVNGGAIMLLGSAATVLQLETAGGTKHLPGIVIDKLAGEVLLEGSGFQAVGSDANLDVVNVFSLTHLDGLLDVKGTIDELGITTTFTQEGGTVTVVPGVLRIGSDNLAGLFQQTGGSFTTFGDVEVFGAFRLGTDTTASALFNLNTGTHTVMGDFFVGSSESKTLQNSYVHGNGCGDAWPKSDTLGQTIVTGAYYFAGTGECLARTGYGPEQQGLSGPITFMGDESQSIWHDDVAEAQFASVIMLSLKEDPTDAIFLEGPVKQNDYGGKLTLSRGVINTETQDAVFLWTVGATDLETSLVDRNVADSGSVLSGSIESYVNGPLARSVRFGNASGGNDDGGYIFPTGSASMVDGESISQFLPLMLQFPNDLGTTKIVTVDIARELAAAGLDWPEEGLVVPAHDGGTLTLDAVGDMTWMVSVDQTITQYANVRIAASGLANVYDYRGLRLVQWDCDGTNPRLAGLYDLEDDGTNVNSFSVNGYIDGMLNVAQKGVQLKRCSIIGIASNFLQNPITLPPQSGGFVSVQFIQNVADTPIDVYVDNNRIGNDWSFQTATQFVNVVRGEHKIDIVAAADQGNSTPMASEIVRFLHGVNYNVIMHGDRSEIAIEVVDEVRLGARDANSVEFYIAHGARDLGLVDLRVIDPTNNSDVIRVLANNIGWKEVGSYVRLAPVAYNVEITTANNGRQIDVYHLELDQYQSQSFVLNLSGTGNSSAQGISLMGVEQDGSTFFPSVITSVETVDELPTSFALAGNYPNPFNESTRVLVDLPERADVSIEVVDILGRRVMTVLAQQVEAGTNRPVWVHASSLASGTYLLRVIANSSLGSSIAAGRMVVAK